MCRTIHQVEAALLKSGELRLPGKKQSRERGTAIEVIVVDATEQPSDRPKKTSAGTTAGRSSAIPKKPK